MNLCLLSPVCLGTGRTPGHVTPHVATAPCSHEFHEDYPKADKTVLLFLCSLLHWQHVVTVPTLPLLLTAFCAPFQVRLCPDI